MVPPPVIFFNSCSKVASSSLANGAATCGSDEMVKITLKKNLAGGFNPSEKY